MAKPNQITSRPRNRRVRADAGWIGAFAAMLALGVAACGRDEGPVLPVIRPPEGAPPAAEKIEPSAKGAIAWSPGEGEPRPDYIEETVDDAAAFSAVWKERGKGAPPAIDFARERVVFVAQEAKNAGYRGAELRRVQASIEGVIVEYGSIEPGVGRSYAEMYRGYIGFYAVVPRREGKVSFHRLRERR